MPLDRNAAAGAEKYERSQGQNPSECGCHSLPDNLDWYVAVTVARKECRARDEAQALGLVAFLPMRWEGLGKARMLVPLFPGYVFVGFDVQAPAWRALYRAPGVKRVLGDDAFTPRPVRRQAIERLMAEAGKAQAIERPVAALLAAGARVEVASTHPWLAGHQGRVVRGGSIVAWVELDGMRFAMRVGREHLQELPHDEAPARRTA